jgi:hypothetical protein
VLQLRSWPWGTWASWRPWKLRPRKLGRPWESWRWPGAWPIAGAAVAVVMLVAVVTVASRAWFDTRDATDRTVAELEATRADIRRTDDELASATADRRQAQATLGNQIAALATRQDERDDAQHGLDVVTLLLAQVQAQLAASQADLQDRTTRLDAFNQCLLGVAQALNQAAVHDTNGLISTINGIESVCAQAGVAL